MPSTYPLFTRSLTPVVCAVGGWLVVASMGAAMAADNEPPIDVPITRGKIDLGSIRPTLGPMGKPTTPEPPSTAGAAPGPNAATAPTAFPPATAALPGPAAAPNTAPTSVTTLGETINNPPRTVADFAALARAKAVADAAAKPGAVAATGGSPPAVATPAAPPPTAPQPAMVAAPTQAPSEKPQADHTPPATATPPSAPTVPARAAATRAPERPAPLPAPDNGMQTLAEKIIAAMARAEDKQKANGKATQPTANKEKAAPQARTPTPDKTPTTSRDYIRAKAAELSGHQSGALGDAHEEFLGDGHWSYEGATGPEHWAKLNPEFAQCARGKRQSPIAIDSATTLQGPAEALDLRYEAVAGSVLNNGHTIQVDLAPGNFLTVRGTRYELTQFHFHHPAEEQINGKTHPMVAHLVHRSAEGNLAVLAVPLAAGAANPVINTVWTHMPLDKQDRVPLPSTGLNPQGLLSSDMRYFQYMGSLTTPPCSEGVLWLVLKTPTTLSPAQLTLFGQLFPSNVRPLQPAHDRPVREAL